VRARVWQRLDWVLLVAVAVAGAAGVVAVAAASASSPRAPAAWAFARKQVGALVVGGLALAACTLVDYHVWARYRRALYGLLCALLLAVLVVGRHKLGASRWIALGPVSLQPSEFAKLMLVMWLAASLAPLAGELRSWRQVAVPVLGTALPAALVAAQPDLGTSLVFGAALVGVLYAAGFPVGKLLGGLGVVGGGAVAAVAALLRWHLPLPLHGYQLQRLMIFLDPQQDPQGAGYQVLQSEMAIGSGRLLGTGLFSGGVNNQLHFLPEPQSDFIFAAISNMTGFVGACSVLALLGIIAWRALCCMAVARDAMGALLAGGIAATWAFQTVLNAGVALGVMPVTGVPLPLFSSGGTALLTNLAAVGVLESIYLRRKKIQF
jgi:rod shape determining protein RodA